MENKREKGEGGIKRMREKKTFYFFLTERYFSQAFILNTKNTDHAPLLQML